MSKTEAFILKIAPGAVECQKQTGIPASFTIAQAALESAWGTSGLAAKANNLFGVKADKSWHGDVINLPTKEFFGGRWVTVDAPWRAYKDWAECLLDHADFFKKNKRYAEAMTGIKTGPEFAKLIAKAGYATDPQYSQKLIVVMKSHNLQQYDL